MTDPNPTPQSGTPVWQPSGPTPAPAPFPYQPPVAQPPYQAPAAQPPYLAAPLQAPYEPGPIPYQPPTQPYPYQPPGQQYPYQPPVQQYPYQPGLAPYPAAGGWQQGAPVAYPPIPTKPSALPVEPKRHSQFLQTPRRRWWKLPIALVVAGVAWLIGSTIVTIPALVYDVINQRIDLTDPVALQSYVAGITTHITPALFLANNVGIALMIPSAWLGLIICGQRPRWLSSVVGGLRWGWLFRILGLILLPYIALEALTIALTGVPQLSWKPYSLFMIFVILLTTPLQCAGEEYGLRGLVNRLFGSYGSSRVSFWIGAIVSSLAFMALHLAQDVYLNTFYFTFGMIACWMAWRTGGLEAGIALHVVNNVLAMAVLPFSDFSGIFNRQAGNANPVDVLSLAAVMLTSMGLVEWQVRRRKPMAVAAPGAAI
ncbi:MAG TPA: CPBP family glutamic-type intramembrane protease [Propionibacteriaceae bacterium]